MMNKNYSVYRQTTQFHCNSNPSLPILLYHVLQGGQGVPTNKQVSTIPVLFKLGLSRWHIFQTVWAIRCVNLKKQKETKFKNELWFFALRSGFTKECKHRCTSNWLSINWGKGHFYHGYCRDQRKCHIHYSPIY